MSKISANKKLASLNKNLQYDLFCNFVTNDDYVSNTMDFWDSIPRFFFTPAFVKKLRTKDGLANSYETKFFYKKKGIKKEYTIRIQPALIRQKDGTDKAFFPGFSEQIIEDTLIKILSKQSYGMHNSIKMETWVKFSLSMIRRELSKQNREKTRSLDQIKHSIQILSKTVFTIFNNDKEVWNGQILNQLITINRQDYQQNSMSYHAALLPIFITDAINKMEYRQLDFNTLMRLKNQLSRWIYKRLINRYTQANPFVPGYTLSYAELINSQLLLQSTAASNRKKIVSALNELIKINIIFSFEVVIKKSGQKIIDMHYLITSSRDLMHQQKASNKRAKNNRNKIELIPINQ